MMEMKVAPALFGVAAALYALLSRLLGIRLLDHPLTSRLARALYFVADGGGDRQAVHAAWSGV
ncbi:MAG: hypothetical protein R3F37_09135 [Candidatus Competibacteraceae bacterium]